MKKIILILLSIISITSFSQTSFQCTKTIDTSNCKLRFFNANSVKIFELNLATTTYTRGVTNEYIIKDGLTQVTIPNNSCLTTPTFNSLASFIDGARIACNSNSGSSVIFPKNLDTTQVDTALDKHILLDSTQVRILNDTLNVKVYGSSIDSIEICFDTITFNSYVVNLPTTVCNGDSAVRVQICNSDTSHQYILNEINNNIKIKCSGLNRRYYIDGTNTITINSSTVCSYSITVLEDAIQITEDGITSPFQFNTGYSTSNSNFGKLLNNSIMITGVAPGAKAVITTIE